MPKIPRLSLLPLLLWSCTSSPESTTTAPDPSSDVFRAINQEVLDHGEGYTNLKTAIESIGHRLTGSENGKQAEEFTYGLFKNYGFEQVEYYPFEVEAWSRGTIQFGIKSHPDQDGYQLIPAVSLAHSPVKVALEAPLIDLGNGLRKDFEAKKEVVSGKAVLVNLRIDPPDTSQRNLHRSEKTALAIEYGASGIVFVNGVEGGVLLTGAASVTGELIPIPALCIGKEDGAKLRGMLASEGAQLFANIEMTNFSERIQARNVIATLEGQGETDEFIVIGGHLDSWDLATGAIDNGIGSFTIIEIARAFKALKLQPRRSIRFVMFMGEEQGLLGSTAWVEHLAATGALDRVRYMMNLDMSGNANGFSTSGRKEMKEFVLNTGERIAAIDTIFQNKLREGAGLHSDHQPFMLEGIPIMGIVSNLDPYVYKFYHSDGDDFSLVNAEHMANCARFAGMMLYALADAGTIPAKRLSSDETRDFLIAHDLKEKLVLGKEWKWEE